MNTEEQAILESRVAALGADAINLSIRIDARLDRQADRLSKIDTRIGLEMSAAAETLSKMIDAVDARLDSQAQTICKLDESVGTLQSVNASQSTRIDDLERAILEEAANVAGLGAHVETRLDAQALVVAKRGEQIEGLSDQVADAEAHIGNQSINLRNAIRHQADRITTINDRLAIHVTRLDASASMHESADMMRQMDHNRADQHQERLDGMSDKIGFAVAPLELKIADLAEKISDEAFRLDGRDDDQDREHGDRLSALESELEDTTRTANSAEMEVNDAKMDVSTLEGKVDSLTADLSSLSHTVNYG